MKMKKLINIIAIFAMTIQFSIAQDLNMAKVAKDWETIKKNFVEEVKKDPELKAVYSNDLDWRINGSTILFEIKESEYTKFHFDKKIGKKYEALRKAYLEKLANNPKYAMPKGDEKDSMLKAYEQQIESLKKDSVNSHKEIATLKQDVRNAKQKLSEKNNKSFVDNVLDNWIIYLIALLELVVIIFLAKKWMSSDDENEELHDRNRELKMQKDSFETQLQRLQNQKPKVETEIKQVVETVKKETPKNDEQPEQKTVFYKYLCQINDADGGYFKRVQDNYDGSSSYYRMFNINDGEADFEFYGDAERAIKKWSSILDSVAEYDGDTDTATKIKTLHSGKVKYDSANERWNVIKKAKLKLY